MKCQYEVEGRAKKKKIPQGKMRSEIDQELSQDASTREEWAFVMKQRRLFPGKRQKGPNLKCMSITQDSTAVGASARNKYVLPLSLWEPQYGELLPLRITCRRFTTNELEVHVVFHSENPPNHLHDLQDYNSNQMTTTTFISCDPDDSLALQPEASPVGISNGTITQPINSPASRTVPYEPSLPSQNDDSSMQYTMSYFSSGRNCSQNSQPSNPQGADEERNSMVKMEPTDDDVQCPSRANVRVKQEHFD